MADPITLGLEALRAECVALTDAGELADYIPQLARADREHFGLALASLDGDVYCAGDSGVEFTIQSVSKPFVLALALEDLGLERLGEHVGAEPSGEPFNAITLEPGTGRPANPLVNAGAILTTSLVSAQDDRERFARITACLSAFAGRSLAVDEAVFASERETGDRNRAIAYLMRSAGSLQADVEATAETYFRQCSLLVTTRDVAVMAATLADGGRNPLTGAQVVREETARHVLSVMTMCGMYDGAGAWMLRVGLPAKSGVSGALLAVSPGQFGVGLFSPPLDARGNSVRAVLACERLSDRFGLHLLHDPVADAHRAKLLERAPAPRSARRRPRAERAALDRLDGALTVLTLRGDIDFAAAELVLRRTRALAGGGRLVLDLADVTRLHPVAEQLLASLVAGLSGREVRVALVAAPVVAGDAGAGRALAGVRAFADLPAALESCEDAVLAAPTAVPLAAHDLLTPLDPAVRAAVAARCEPRAVRAGTPALGTGDVVFAVEFGRVATFDRGARRAAVGAGGIVSVLDLAAGARSTRAELDTAGAMLTGHALAGLEPDVTAALWRSVASWMTDSLHA